MLRDAIFSECRTWRYVLRRIWDEQTPPLMVIGLNPSTADETADDPTIRRCMGFARDLGAGGLVMCNLFAYRSTDPCGLRSQLDPVGPDNDSHIAAQAHAAGMVIAAWGVHGAYREQDRAVRLILAAHGVPLHCLGRTREGHPRHPLYLPKSARPVPL